jgi:hypothetical protein
MLLKYPHWKQEQEEHKNKRPHDKKYATYTHSWSRVILEKPPIVQLLENFPAFYGTRRFITAFT